MQRNWKERYIQNFYEYLKNCGLHEERV